MARITYTTEFSSGEPPRLSIRIPSTNVTVIPDILRALKRFADSPNACEEASDFLWENTAKKIRTVTQS
jgi:hypothetical protein